MVQKAYEGQAYTVEWTVPGAFDGVTLSPPLRAPSTNQDPQSIYRPVVEGNLGLVDVDYVAVTEADRRGARGMRYVPFLTLEASVPGDVGAALEVVDATVDPPVVQEVIASLAGVTEGFFERILVPQGSVLRISGFPMGLEPHRLRATIQYLTTEMLIAVQKGVPVPVTVPTWAQVLASGNVSGGSNAVISDGDFLSLQGNAFMLSDTLANLEAKGTAEGIVANQTVAWDTTARGFAHPIWVGTDESVWVHSSIDPERGFIAKHHWDQFWAPAQPDGWVSGLAAGGAATNAGASATALADSEHPGVLVLTIDGTLNSRAGIRPTGGTAGGGVRLSATNPLISRTIARHGVKPSGTDRFEIYIGQMSDMGTTVQPTNGCFFVLDATSGFWITRTRLASVSADKILDGTGGTVAVDGTINVWRTFMVVSTLNEVKFFVDGVLVATHGPTRIPTGQLYHNSPWLWRTNAEGGAANLNIDMVAAEQVSA